MIGGDAGTKAYDKLFASQVAGCCTARGLTGMVSRDQRLQHNVCALTCDVIKVPVAKLYITYEVAYININDLPCWLRVAARLWHSF
jgi:hypothetical protein